MCVLVSMCACVYIYVCVVCVHVCVCNIISRVGKVTFVVYYSHYVTSDLSSN